MTEFYADWFCKTKAEYKHRNKIIVLNLVFGFYNTGVIWAHEIDIFRTWKLIDKKDFHTVQLKHWKKLPYWVFIPVGLAIAGSVGLIWYHPAGSPLWAIYGNLVCQLLALILTAVFWGRWQARLSTDSFGSESQYLDKILKTHGIRTLLINAYAIILFLWTAIIMTLKHQSFALPLSSYVVVIDYRAVKEKSPNAKSTSRITMLFIGIFYRLIFPSG